MRAKHPHPGTIHGTIRSGGQLHAHRPSHRTVYLYECGHRVYHSVLAVIDDRVRIAVRSSYRVTTERTTVLTALRSRWQSNESFTLYARAVVHHVQLSVSADLEDGSALSLYI